MNGSSSSILIKVYFVENGTCDILQFNGIFIGINRAENYRNDQAKEIHWEIIVPSYMLLIGPHCFATSRSTSIIFPSLVFTRTLLSVIVD